MDSAPIQIFIKNEKGQIWGPLALTTVELLLDSGIVTGKVLVSPNGEDYAMPGRFPEYRDAFPQELWGVDVPAGAVVQRAAAVAPPQEMVLGGDAPKAVAPAAPQAGAANAPFTAGPGARAAAQARSNVQRGSGARPGGTDSGPKPAMSAPAPAPVAPVAAAPAAKPPPGPPPAPKASSGPKAPPVPVPAEPGAAPPTSGSLAETSAVKLYSLVAGAEMTALISFKLPDREIQLYLKKGNPEYVSSTHAEDELAAFLLKTSLCQPDKISQAESQKDRFGGDLLSALFGTGALNPGAVFGQLIDRSKALLGRALLATDGTFTVEPKELPSQKAMPLGQRWAVLAELVRRIPPSELKKRLQAAWELPAMKSGGRIAPADLRLTPQEMRALAHVDGVRSLAQFQKDMPQEFETIMRMVFFLGELDGVSFAAVPVRRAAEPPPAAPPPAAKPAGAAPPPAAKPAAAPAPASKPAPAAAPAAATKPPTVAAAPGAAPAPAAAPRAAPKTGSFVSAAAVGPPKTATPVPAPLPVAETLEELRALFEKIKGQTYFETLGISDKADAGAVKAAYFRLAKVYHPDTVMETAAPEFAKLKQDIFGRIGDAYRTLTDDKLRANYVDELKHGGAGEQVDVAQILLAEELFQKGCILVKARKWADAVKMLDDAIKANAEEPEFLAWRGYAKYFANTDKAVGHAEAVKDINAALKRNDRIAAAHYFNGHIAKLTNNMKLAEQEFKKTVDLNPDHIDAQRELRMLKK